MIVLPYYARHINSQLPKFINLRQNLSQKLVNNYKVKQKTNKKSQFIAEIIITMKIFTEYVGHALLNICNALNI